MIGLYSDNDTTDDRRNSEVSSSLMSRLRKRNAERYGLRQNVPRSYLIRNTTLEKRRSCLGYGLESLESENAVLFTGQCLVKDYDDPECPVTLEDAIECEKLRELLQRHPMPAVCIYPDSTYKAFVEGWSGKSIDERAIERATEMYMTFRRNTLPRVVHVRSSEVDSTVKEKMQKDTNHLVSRIKRVYGGRLLNNGQTHQLQRTILDYGIKTVFIPAALGYESRSIAVFAEPDEICSVLAAELIGSELGMGMHFGLIGQIPLPSLGFPQFIRMYSAGREGRIHLNEKDEEIRSKLEDDMNFLLLALYLSPLTTDDEIEYIGRSKERRIGLDILMNQIDMFRRHLP